jgi:hypothetical protein
MGAPTSVGIREGHFSTLSSPERSTLWHGRLARGLQGRPAPDLTRPFADFSVRSSQLVARSFRKWAWCPAHSGEREDPMPLLPQRAQNLAARQSRSI